MFLDDDPTPLQAAQELLDMACSRATDGGRDMPKQPWADARDIVMKSSARELAPRWIRNCRAPNDLWAHVRQMEDSGRMSDTLGTWAARRQYLTEELQPLLDRLEGLDAAPVDPHTSAALDRLDAKSAKAAWAAATDLRDKDPAGAVAQACTLLESTLKVILDDHSVQYGTRDDLPKLYKLVAKALGLDAAAFDDEPDAQMALRGAANVVQGIGELRNRDSTAHGKGRQGYRMTPRHAGLVVAMAGGLATFLVETHEHRQQARP